MSDYDAPKSDEAMKPSTLDFKTPSRDGTGNKTEKVTVPPTRTAQLSPLPKETTAFANTVVCILQGVIQDNDDAIEYVRNRFQD